MLLFNLVWYGLLPLTGLQLRILLDAPDLLLVAETHSAQVGYPPDRAFCCNRDRCPPAGCLPLAPAGSLSHEKTGYTNFSTGELP